ncbi:hypothetical protein P7K49_031992 [Saguinus oedipus]|uniref:Uncharacterized protein n=1 Tax=Saguinus oedipus TaxID=9490 RepID=A0ABQ9TWY3_SAGOE|nr:hypothetical protein P7K49_031992 [Saguinus oedipus]
MTNVHHYQTAPSPDTNTHRPIPLPLTTMTTTSQHHPASITLHHHHDHSPPPSPPPPFTTSINTTTIHHLHHHHHPSHIITIYRHTPLRPSTIMFMYTFQPPPSPRYSDGKNSRSMENVSLMLIIAQKEEK